MFVAFGDIFCSPVHHFVRLQATAICRVEESERFIGYKLRVRIRGEDYARVSAGVDVYADQSFAVERSWKIRVEKHMGSAEFG